MNIALWLVPAFRLCKAKTAFYRHITIVVVAFLSMFTVTLANASDVIEVGANEDGHQRTGIDQVFFDPDRSLTVYNVQQALLNKEFQPLATNGSTGLIKGDTWTAFTLENVTEQRLSLHLEYVDHQVIEVEAYASVGSANTYVLLQKLSMNEPFAHRPVTHNRFVIPVEIPAKQQLHMLVRFDATDGGFSYPSMRIWSPNALVASHARETGLLMFLFGGFFLMALFSFVAGFAAGRKLFFLYSLYSLSKITCWATILGLTHQHVLTDTFHWSLMSISGAVTIVCGLVFARAFLSTRTHTPRMDYVLLFMIANAFVLLTAAIFQVKLLAIITITLALILYPVVLIVGFLRWRQGASEAGVFTLAWAALVIGLVMQVLRDVGAIEHSMFNYYLPPVASYIEMLTIMFAMGLLVKHLRRDKEATEREYREHLEKSKERLEQEVKMRTIELERAKTRAEVEANTDDLTGIRNRRSFLIHAEQRLELALRQHQSCCLLMIDLDHFKRINDTHGHNVGDEALKQFAITVDTLIRETDIFGRLGGEEFVLFITEPCDAAVQLAERLLQKTTEIHVDSPKGLVKLTASIGIACAIPPINIEDLLHKADEAMYRAKAQGRNCAVLAQ
ncbi:sensor domain-containing diguanylate cyclase [Alteromonas facilis]|uniref:sensor domain-containing diguanylate cyclase n=1 Tax=Alteromonas facilis TaxID=2048004 RepID=UPI000F5C71A3|nr:diguanylate cyclase [Alteromonas facilis]